MHRSRVRWAATLTAVLLCVCGLASAPEAVAATKPAKPYDFNGDGYVDLAIGVAGEDVGRTHGAGGVNVLYGSAKGLTTKRAQLWTQASRGIKGKPAEYESFGQELTSGDFDCDGRADLAVWVRSDVAILYGGRHGLTRRDQLLTISSDGRDAWDEGPVSMATGDFNADGCHELAIASYRGVRLFRGSARGLRTATAVSVPTSIAYGLEDGLVAGDLTGDGVDDLVAAEADGASAPRPAAAVVLIPGSSTGLQLRQARRLNTDNIPLPAPRDAALFSWRYGESMAIGDFDGDGHADLAVGDGQAGREQGTDDRDEPLQCPGPYDLCSGAVVVIPGTRTGPSSSTAQLWTGARLKTTTRAFGETVAAGDTNGDGRDELAVSQRWSVDILKGSSTGLTPTGRRSWSWDIPGIKGSFDDPGSSFGCGAIRLLDHGRGKGADLSVGSQHYSEFRGAVNVVYASASGLSATGDQLWQQSTRGVPGKAAHSDEFGGNSRCWVDFG